MHYYELIQMVKDANPTRDAFWVEAHVATMLFAFMPQSTLKIVVEELKKTW